MRQVELWSSRKKETEVFRKQKEHTTAIIARGRATLNTDILNRIRLFETEHGVSVDKIEMFKLNELHKEMGFTQKVMCLIKLL